MNEIMSNLLICSLATTHNFAFVMPFFLSSRREGGPPQAELGGVEYVNSTINCSYNLI